MLRTIRMLGLSTVIATSLATLAQGQNTPAATIPASTMSKKFTFASAKSLTNWSVTGDVTIDAAKNRQGKGCSIRIGPGGKALLGAKTVVKPLPKGLDDWSHPYHGPDNNPQSTDQLARAPYLTQFIAYPKFCPSPAVTVAGRKAGRSG